MDNADLDVVDLFERAAAELTGRELDVGPETVLFDLGLDSITIASIVAHIEDAAHVSLPDTELANVRTLGELAELVRRVASAR
jgi:acyl carrier protein